MFENITASFYEFIAINTNQSISLNSILSTSYLYLQEVFKTESWHTKFEVNLCVVLCLIICVETAVLVITWQKYSKSILESKKLYQEEEDQEEGR